MKYAFLIAAHSDAEQLLRLMKRLLSLGDIYVHIDKKVKDSDYLNKIKAFASNVGGQISLVEPRISIAWGGFSQCVGQKVLLENCLNRKSYDRVFFLSGLDYVLVSDDEFKSFFDANKDKEFVCGFNLTTSNIKSQQGRFKYYHYFRDIPLKHNSILRRIIIVGTRLFLKGLGLRKPLQVPISQNEKWDIYYGSSWMSMTNECAKYVLSQIKENSVLNKYFSTAYTPDELYIPTIVMNSVFRKHAIESKQSL